MSIPTIHERLPAGAHLEEYRGGEAVAVYSDTPSEFRALISGCGVWEGSWRAKVRLTGADRVRWLNGMITNNVRDLDEGHGVYAFLLNPQGHILADLYAYHCGGSLVVDTDRWQLKNVRAIFDHYIIMDDVEASDLGGTLDTIGLAGPESGRVLRQAGLNLPPLQPLQLARLGWGQSEVTAVRGDSSRTESYELWVAGENSEGLWEALVKAGATPGGTRALELLRIASGVARYGQDIRERDLPQETGQVRALHFTKGCYVGQEIVERIRSRGNVHRRFTGFRIEGTLPAAGTKIRLQGKDAGEITSAASLPLAKGDLQVALGYIRRESGPPGTVVEMDDAKGVVTDLPFAEAFEG